MNKKAKTQVGTLPPVGSPDRSLYVLDQRALAEAILNYEDLAAQMALLQSDILDAVMYYERTVEIAGIRAKYSEGRKSYDWEGYLLEMKNEYADLPEAIKKNTKVKTTTSVSWSAIGKDLGVKTSDLVEAGFMSQAAPSAKIEVIG